MAGIPGDPLLYERDPAKRQDAIAFVMTMATTLAHEHPEAAQQSLRVAIKALITLGCGEEEIELAIHDASGLVSTIAKALLEGKDPFDGTG